MEGTTQEELNEEFNPYATATLNEDGSVTVSMSKFMHDALIGVIRTEFMNELNSMPGTEDFPNVTAIEVDDDFTEFNLTTTATVATGEEPMSALYIYMLGKLYNILNLTETNVVTINFKNADSGEIIYTSDAAGMDEFIESVE